MCIYTLYTTHRYPSLILWKVRNFHTFDALDGKSKDLAIEPELKLESTTHVLSLSEAYI